MSSYAPTTLANAGSIMAPKMGLTWEDNRTEVIGYVNRYRNYLYNRYNERRLFDSVFQCFVPQRFRTLCRQCDPCASKFLGFTLPRFMAGVTGVWTHGIPLLQRSAWREQLGLAAVLCIGLPALNLLGESLGDSNKSDQNPCLVWAPLGGTLARRS